MKYIKSRPGSTIRMEYFELMKGFLFSPEETFRTVKDTDYGDTLVFPGHRAYQHRSFSSHNAGFTHFDMDNVWRYFSKPGFGTLTGFRIVIMC